ncbi:FimV/HubP family polar landmark protein [Rhodoferax sp.]|uniref:FimV/HubP family polar landmark protein n=1 Tax=Rhodoferax sp. TaxID=50421 RepID=UPI002852AED7|nr:FimV/HubP family polar landmark protein [Rhodoferax sp.]
MIAKSHHYQLTTLAIAALLSVWVPPAAALSLGRITVQSALGEPLKAEIDVLDINAEEASSLVTKVAAPEAFQAAGLDYNPALSSLRATLQRRPDGRAYLRLSSDRAVGEPFVDMILEANWNSGRIVRDYTMLFDPPSLRKAAPGTPTSAQLPTPAPDLVARPAKTLPVPPQTDVMAAPSPSVTRRETTPTKPAAVAAKPAATAAKPVAEAVKPTLAAQTTHKPAVENQTVKIKPGDTAGEIAITHKSASVSLDQMLVALLRANPDAFIQDNVNRIRSGAIVTIPSQEQAIAIAPAEATQLITAQSQDFNDYRRKFASNVPTTKVAPASRDVSGKIQATVEDKKPTAATTDKLTLSKGAVQGKSSEDALAQARNAEKAASRAEELAKNIKELNQLASAASAPATITPPAAALAPASSAPVAAPASATQSTIPAPKKPVPAPVVPEPAPESSFIDDLLANPMLPAGAAALVALLAGLGIYKARQRKKAEELDSTFANSDLAFSGASGGQSVDTGDSLTTGSSMVYSPSQLDAVDDVDPVAEADVYLAYGRDLQAEEILKDALRTRPQRVAIHQKLLEIYAKRKDVKAFESIAALAFNLTDGTGTEWEQICEKGLAIDPDNALYLPGGQPLPSQLSEFDKTQPSSLPSTRGDLDAGEVEKSDQGPIATGHGDLDLDLDLDFSLDEAEPGQTPAAASPQSDAVPTAFSGLGDFEPTNLPTMTAELAPAHDEPHEELLEEPSEPITARGALTENLDFTMPSLDLETPPTHDDSASANKPSEQAASKPDNELMSFDLGSLSLDLGEDRVTVPGEFIDEAMDPLETKLALADEFRAIGDDDGARALIEEVIAEASGDLKSKAQNALAKL